MPPKKHYLNNSSLLREIHKSKNSYCYYVDQEDTDFDAIVNDLDEINHLTIDEAKENRRKRLEKQRSEELVLTGKYRQKEADQQARDEYRDMTFELQDLVFRVMTYEHIPEAENKGRSKYHRIPFPPFKHYRFIGNQPKEVLRSHWENGFDNGFFRCDQGKLTSSLAQMIMLLVERIARKPNFSGYSFIEDMKSEALVHLCDVALKFNEAKGDNPFAFYTTVVNHKFKGVLSAEKQIRNTRDELLIQNNMTPSYTKQNEQESE